MANISVPQETVVKIIDDSDPDGDYELQPDGGTVNLAKRRGTAQEQNGREIEDRRPAILTKSGNYPIYAYAPDENVDLQIAKSSFRLVKLPPQSGIQISDAEITAGAVDVTDDATRELGVLQSITSPVDASASVITVTEESPIDVEDRASREIGKIRSQDSGGTLIDPPEKSQFGNYGDITSFTQDTDGTLPSNNVPNGVGVLVKAHNDNDELVTVNGAITLMEGDGVVLQVNNTDQISVSFAGASDEVGVIFEDVV